MKIKSSGTKDAKLRLLLLDDGHYGTGEELSENLFLRTNTVNLIESNSTTGISTATAWQAFCKIIRGEPCKWRITRIECGIHFVPDIHIHLTNPTKTSHFIFSAVGGDWMIKEASSIYSVTICAAEEYITEYQSTKLHHKPSNSEELEKALKVRQEYCFAQQTI